MRVRLYFYLNGLLFRTNSVYLCDDSVRSLFLFGNIRVTQSIRIMFIFLGFLPHYRVRGSKLLYATIVDICGDISVLLPRFVLIHYLSVAQITYLVHFTNVGRRSVHNEAILFRRGSTHQSKHAVRRILQRTSRDVRRVFFCRPLTSSTLYHTARRCTVQYSHHSPTICKRTNSRIRRRYPITLAYEQRTPIGPVRFIR